tara:strand:- start:69328 stop:71079 length:1752 start_codon:yes stop_codon:yes gene_type:complete
MSKIKLGDLLVEQKIIKEEDLERALTSQKKTGQKLGDVLIELELINENDLLSFLAKQLDLPFLDLKSYSVKPHIIKLVPETFARRFKMLPIDKLQDQFWVAASDPTDLSALDQICSKLGQTPRLVVVREEDIKNMLDEVYKRKDDIKTFVGELEQEMKQAGQSGLAYEEILEDTPVKRLLNSIFEEAILNNASDIHIEPAQNAFRIRQRIDGILNEQIIAEKSILAPLVLRIKLMAGLNISEHRLPQDGRFSVQYHERKVDVRVATMPVLGQEAVVLRILDQSSGLLAPEELGMSAEQLQIFKKHLSHPHGMILVTGPTGSGKTTTLYSALSAVNEVEKKIITVEDPIEYTLARINQVQVQTKIGLNFANILRSALRHDPDVVMVGEIRDSETANIALRAAITGHLVLSTLHTNDAISSAIRLMDMGVHAYLAASSVKLIIAQRLIRRICTRCRITYEPSEVESKWLQSHFGPAQPIRELMMGKGCTHCGMTGYKGRMGIYELLEIDNVLSEALRAGDMNTYFEKARASTHYKPLLYSGYEYMNQGLTTLSEIMRLNFESELDDMHSNEKILLPRDQSSRDAG